MNYLINAIALGMTVFPLASALPLNIISGSPTDTYCVAGCQVWTQAGLPATFPTLVYAPTIHYSIPLATGVYFGWLTFIEPNKTAAGQRLVTITVNSGQKSLPVDIFKTAGADNTIVQFTFIGHVTTNVLDIVVQGNPGQNAVLSGISIMGAPIDQAILGLGIANVQ